MLIVFAVLANCAPTLATTSVTFDESWWNGLDEPGRLSTVQGLTGAYTSGWLAANEALFAAALPALSFAQRKKLADEMVRREGSASNPPEFSKTFGTYVDEINDYYANNPTKETRLVPELIGCFADHPPKKCEHDK